MFSAVSREVPKVETEHRQINTHIPAPGTFEILQDLGKTESRSMHGQLPIIWAKAEDCYIYDIGGNKFLDMTSTIFVANVGHSNPAVSRAIRESLDRKLLSTYAYGNKEKSRYLESLLRFTGEDYEKAFLMSSGTEASEAVLKLIRMHGASIGKGRVVVTFEGNWHGRTMGAQLLSSNPDQSEWIGFEDPNIEYVPFPFLHEVNESAGPAFFAEVLDILEKRGVSPAQDIAGFYLETFQGWGAHFYPTSFVQALAGFAKKNNILLAFDEMQAGFGRTGKKFGFMHYGVTPDLFAVGKGMGNGVPISGVIGRGAILDLPNVGNMSSTHSGNPLVCSAALAVLSELESKRLVEGAAEKGEVFHASLAGLMKDASEISRITGKGLIAAIIFSEEIKIGAGKFASQVAERCMELGLLVVHTGRESIKLGPPLTTPLDALAEAVDVLQLAIEYVRTRNEI
jgi:4-aminobutyrate aminotransferase-like enzyme